jgi:hypothetical protein
VVVAWLDPWNVTEGMEILEKSCASIDARTPQLGYFAAFTRPPLLAKQLIRRGV